MRDNNLQTLFGGSTGFIICRARNKLCFAKHAEFYCALHIIFVIQGTRIGQCHWHWLRNFGFPGDGFTDEFAFLGFLHAILVVHDITDQCFALRLQGDNAVLITHRGFDGDIPHVIDAGFFYRFEIFDFRGSALRNAHVVENRIFFFAEAQIVQVIERRFHDG